MADMLLQRADGTLETVPATDGVFECPCGSQFWYLLEDGTLQCASTRCGKIVPGGRWERLRPS